MDSTQEDGREPKHVRLAAYWVAGTVFTLLNVSLIAALFIVFIYPRPENSELTKIVTERFAAIVGLPAAAIMAFTVVWLFRATEGKLQWEGLGFKFEGASGPVLLWVIVYLAIVGSIKLAW